MSLSTAGFPDVGPMPVSDLVLQPGVAFVIDTKEALGYLVNTDGTYASMPVLLGQNRVIRYIGRTYKATTPEARWIVKSVHTQGDRVTFGKEGTFLRLYKDGTERTAYGIHTHKYFEQMLGEGNPYRSLGCVLVAKNMLDIIQKAYEVNGGSLTVVTSYGLDESKIADVVDPPAVKTADALALVKG